MIILFIFVDDDKRHKELRYRRGRGSKTDGKICWLFQQMLRLIFPVIIVFFSHFTECVLNYQFRPPLISFPRQESVMSPGESGATLFSHYWDLIRNRCQNNNSLSSSSEKMRIHNNLSPDSHSVWSAEGLNESMNGKHHMWRADGVLDFVSTIHDEYNYLRWMVSGTGRQKLVRWIGFDLGLLRIVDRVKICSPVRRERISVTASTSPPPLCQ